MREGITKWIESDAELTVCGAFDKVAEGLGAVSRLKPDLVVSDISLPDGNGLELVKDIKAIQFDLPVVILSMHDETDYAMRAMRAGACGYVMKKAGGADLVAAIKHVLAGGYAFSERVSHQFFSQLSGRAPGRRSPLANLTDREFEIMQQYGEGRTSGEIAHKLRLSPKTVGTHRVNICKKLKLKSTAELIRYAVHYLDL